MKQAVKRFLLASGFYSRRLARRRFPGVAVLAYHGVRQDGSAEDAMPFPGLHVRRSELAAHCRLISETCHPIGWPELSAALYGTPLPARPVLVTFDDGYRSLLELALPVLSQFRIPAVVFATTAPIAERRLFWFDALARARGEAAVERAKELPEAEWRQVVAETAADALPGDPCAPLAVDELKELAGAPGITIGGHTVAHPILSRLDGAAQEEEIAFGRRQLMEWTGGPVEPFAYPNGRPGLDFDAGTAARVATAGFTAAFTTHPGLALAAGNGTRYELPRFLMLAGIPAAELAHRLTFSWHTASRS
jgi:peptidoglycan/xylan/chitin deacetylase (PgdA/CDA1 family)